MVISLLLYSVWISGAIRGEDPGDKLDRNDAIRRVAMGHLMVANRDPNHEVFFLEVSKGQDPSDKLLADFRLSKYMVKAVSDSKRLTGPDSVRYEIADKETNAVGAIVFTEDIDTTQARSARIVVGLYSGGLYGVTYRYTLVERRGKWYAKRRERLRVS
jgi:hypothetical protein